MRRTGWAAASTLCTLMAAACSREANQEQPPAPRIHDFGEVSIDSGTQRLPHEFTFTNSSEEPVEILDVKKTCGCVGAVLERTTLQPGESTRLQLVLEVSTTGRVMQGAALVLSNHEVQRYSMTAYGTISRELRAFAMAPHIDPVQREIGVRAYLIDKTGAGETAPLTALQPDGVGIEFDEWITLEPGSQTYGRPKRQLANLVLDFSRYEGEFPVAVALGTESGSSFTLTVHGPPGS